MKTLLQRLQVKEDSSHSMAEKYYSVLSAINNMHLTEREIQLIAFTAVKGDMTLANHREEFCRRYETTSATINNIISKLKKMGVLIKTNGKVKVTPVILLDFNNNVTLEIKLEHNENTSI
jgi:DNA-binding MarR family transcriptional regulator